MAVIPGAYLWTRDSTRPHPDGRLLRTGVRFERGWPLARRLGFALPDGWVACGGRFEVETTSPQQRSLIQQHFGARRFAYNWALATVKANLDARAADPSVPLLAWTLPTLRKAWNQAKVTVAPWWPSCSKEAYASGIADLTIALQNWSASTHCHRGGRKVGFPRFKARHRDRGRVRFSTGAMRLEADRRHLTLPVGGRLFVSVATIVVLVPRSPREPNARCGIDLGVGTEWAVIAHADGTVERVPHPVEWASAQKQHRRLARRASSRLTQRRGRARPQKTTERWRRPMTPEPNPILGRGTSHRGARKGATQMRAELVTVG